ncbi:MAG: diaminopimelate decarboxylase [Desulfobacteraceae bacterium]|nr:diaminopimelate decarboxylase [Desulfobacteraceae bacterium]
MHHFHYIQNRLHCEAVPVADIALDVGTPLYLYSHATLERHFKAFQNAFAAVKPLVCYSAKANSSQAILTLFRQWGGGLDIVSGGELFRGLKAGFISQKVVYSGVGKRADEIDAAISHGILAFNIESMEELNLINARAGELKRRARAAIRVNPDVDPKTHPYISTGLKKTKFGIDIATAVEGYRAAQQMANIEIVGVDCHLGSQITTLEPFEQALAGLKQLVTELRHIGISLQHLDVGGGLGITYKDETPPGIEAYARAVTKVVQETGLQLILEPGRAIVGNAAILVTKVLYRKQTGEKQFVIVDAGMNDLMRPALYKAYHAIEPVEKQSRATIVADVVGPICESSDFLAQDRSMVDVLPGELLAVMGAGAYGFVMSSNYCSRIRAAEVLVKEDRFDLIRQRENLEDLVRGELVPAWVLKAANHMGRQ